MAQVLFSKSMSKVIESLDFSKLGKNVAIKVHFGERGCKTYVSPKIVRAVYERVISTGRKATLVECNVLYRGSRTNSTDHLAVAKEHGFDMPIDILDGEHGQDAIEIDGCKIGAGIEKYDSLVVISHFKGHIAAGFGAAIKNVGMGLGSRAGKLDMHAGLSPEVNSKCTGCRACIRACNAKAIALTNDGKAMIDPKLCEGCAMCVAVCSHGAIEIPWSARSSSELQRRTAEYAKAILARFENPVFINVLENITKDCDCFGVDQKPIMQDVGMLASNDIVAIDKASLDLAQKHSQGSFSRLNRIDKDQQIAEAEKAGLGTGKYEIVNL